MNTRELAYLAEELTTNVEKIESLETALFQAIYRGDFTVDSYE